MSLYSLTSVKMIHSVYSEHDIAAAILVSKGSRLRFWYKFLVPVPDNFGSPEKFCYRYKISRFCRFLAEMYIL